MIGIITLLVTLALAMVITKVATVALMLTGMSRESARFQARSAFTGVGFTTKEAENVVDHPVRRRIVMLLMLLGNAGLVTVVSSLILSFVGGSEGRHGWLGIILLFGGIALLWAVATSRWVDRRMSTIIERALKKWTNLDTRDYASLFRLSKGYGIAELIVEPDHWMVGKTLSRLDLKERGILVLGIQRKTGDYIGAPHGETQFEVGDTVTVYGSDHDVASMCSRAEKCAL